MNPHFFEGIDGIERRQKPRDYGLTMVIDWGLGRHEQEDLIQIAAKHFDFAKIAVGISRLLSNDVLEAKLKKYRQHQIEPFAGGMFLEYAEVSGKADLYFPATVQAGYRWVEVSDNLGAVSIEWKRRTIRQAVREYGLQVMGEVGKKEGLASEIPFPDDAQGCLDAGAALVLLEAAELVSEDVDTAKAVEIVVERVGLEKVMFELPRTVDYWSDCTSHPSLASPAYRSIWSRGQSRQRRTRGPCVIGSISPGAWGQRWRG